MISKIRHSSLLENVKKVRGPPEETYATPLEESSNAFVGGRCLLQAAAVCGQTITQIFKFDSIPTVMDCFSEEMLGSAVGNLRDPSGGILQHAPAHMRRSHVQCFVFRA